MNLESIIEALEKELAGYARRGLAARAKQVETELRRLGWSPGATPSDVVPSESASTPHETPAKASRKASKPVKDDEAPKTPRRKK
ncbi:hypothetical protein UFOVP227_14 [uncultured Caudovirales phage]|uniref:Uncharacterized protein n=1 Tax=uncultured Caudovirales phage TaxID=2100421 RepID=A0A6J7WS98_9CAUD|nr:hypothetical protein UFOVP227_14 [uncultured Caudovirales phage]